MGNGDQGLFDACCSETILETNDVSLSGSR
jgi:hypothetical protein